MLITEILARNARLYDNEIALVERDPAAATRRAITWDEFDQEANRISRLLADMDIGPGRRVMHLLMNSLEWLPLYFGILRTGAWVVPLNFRFSADDIRYCTEVAEGDVFFFRARVRRAGGENPPPTARSQRIYLCR